MARKMEKAENGNGRIKRFFTQDIWTLEAGDLSSGKGFLLRAAQVTILAVRDFFVDHCMLRASALTYATLLSIIPLLALMFAVLKGFGVQNQLEPIILEKIAVGSEEIVSQIIGYINNTNVGRLGTVGLVLLVVTVLALLSNIEEIFNHVWGVKETRPIFRRFADYFSVVVMGPIFILAAISMNTTLQSQALVQRLMDMAFVGQVIFFLFKILPFVAMWAAFTFLYLFMPNTKVTFRAGLIGGIFGGTLWQLAQWGYVTFQVGVARYNAIYGTMAALPILMVWIYVSWVIVLLGLEVSFAAQNLRTLHREIRRENWNFASRELVALNILLVVAENFYRGAGPWSQEKIATNLEIPPRLAQNILQELVRLEFLSQVQNPQDDEIGFQPARAPEVTELYQVLQALREDGISYSKLRKTPERQVIADLEGKLESAGYEALEGVTLQDLVQQMIGKQERSGQSESK